MGLGARRKKSAFDRRGSSNLNPACEDLYEDFRSLEDFGSPFGCGLLALRRKVGAAGNLRMPVAPDVATYRERGQGLGGRNTTPLLMSRGKVPGSWPRVPV